MKANCCVSSHHLCLGQKKTKNLHLNTPPRLQLTANYSYLSVVDKEPLRIENMSDEIVLIISSGTGEEN